jgi:hypothetical protein
MGFHAGAGPNGIAAFECFDDFTVLAAISLDIDWFIPDIVFEQGGGFGTGARPILGGFACDPA